MLPVVISINAAAVINIEHTTREHRLYAIYRREEYTTTEHCL